MRTCGGRFVRLNGQRVTRPISYIISHRSYVTRSYYNPPNYIQIIRVYTSFCSCAWPTGALVVDKGRREDDDKAREESDLYLQLRQMEAPNFGLSPLATSYSGCRANPL